MKDPNIFYIDRLLEHCEANSARITAPDGHGAWVPARPLGYSSIKQRVKCAWLVFTGKADALLWRGQ